MDAQRVCWPGPGKARLERFEPREPGPGEVLIETEVTLISPGTERAFLLGLPNAQSRFPSYPGYSNVGRVAAVGPGVEALAVGDRAAAMVGHASHAVTAAARCAKVPEALAAEAAVYFSLGAIALQAIRKTRLELGEPLAVLGLGLIGNLALQLGRLQGALPAVGLEPDAGRRALALECGGDACFDPGDVNGPEALAAATGGGPTVVVEATGAPEVINQAFAVAAVGARVVLLASTRGVTETNFYRDVHKKGLTVLGAHNAARPPRDSSPGFWTLEDDFRVVLRLLAGGRLRVAPLTSAVLPAEEAPAAYAALATWRKDQLGVLLRWKEPEA